MLRTSELRLNSARLRISYTRWWGEMMKYQERAEQRHRAARKSSMTVWTAVLALVLVVLLIVALGSSAPPRLAYQGAVVLALLLLVLRQVQRRLKGRVPRAAQPDPKSSLKLN
jgi:protein-S-isoprenylcysteine O-methyltransferase Ste14